MSRNEQTNKSHKLNANKNYLNELLSHQKVRCAKADKKIKKMLDGKERSFLNLIWGFKFSRVHSPEKKATFSVKAFTETKKK